MKWWQFPIFGLFRFCFTSWDKNSEFLFPANDEYVKVKKYVVFRKYDKTRIVSERCFWQNRDGRACLNTIPYNLIWKWWCTQGFEINIQRRMFVTFAVILCHAHDITRRMNLSSICTICAYLYLWLAEIHIQLMRMSLANAHFYRWNQQHHIWNIHNSISCMTKATLRLCVCLCDFSEQSSKIANGKNIAEYIKKKNARIKMTRTAEEGLYNHISLIIMWIVIMCLG